VGLAIALIPVPTGLNSNAWYYFALFAAIIAGVITEPIPSAAIGLIGITVAALSGFITTNPSDSIKWALSGFSDTTIWLIFAAFMFALGYAKTGLGRRIALLLVKFLGKRTLGLGYAIAFSDLILAPFTPSNTARSAGTIFPIIKNIPEIYGSYPGPTARKIGNYLMWTAFATTCVTSSMFLTGLAPNVLALSLIKQNLKIDISWNDWFIGFLPVGIILFVTVPILAYWLYPPEIKQSPEASSWAEQELNKMGKIKRNEILLLSIVLIVLVLWIAGSNLINATTVALIGISLMLILGIVSWEDIIGYKSAWNILIWFGTLVTLADGLTKTGFIKWIASSTSTYLKSYTSIMILVIVITLFFFLHYLFASLTAHTTALLPTFLLILANLGGFSLKIIALSLSYTLGLIGILTPYATGPAPVYYASGYIESKKFWILGLIFGLYFFIVYVALGLPWLLFIIR